MKKIGHAVLIIVFLTTSAAAANADVNEILTFTNLTDEELYVELSIFDNSGQNIYDLYVLPGGTSIADFWADTFDAMYSACAYGEITGDFYGCMDGYISDHLNNVYFDTCVYHQPGIDLLFRVIDIDNILFASEMFGAVRGIDPETGHYFDDTKRYVDHLDLTDEDRAKVFELNARRVYPRLDQALKARGR